MNIEHFSADRVRQAVREYASRHSLHHLAKASGVDWASLKRFIADGKGISIENLEKLWPHLWTEGDSQESSPPAAA